MVEIQNSNLNYRARGVKIQVTVASFGCASERSLSVIVLGFWSRFLRWEPSRLGSPPARRWPIGPVSRKQRFEKVQRRPKNRWRKENEDSDRQDEFSLHR